MSYKNEGKKNSYISTELFGGRFSMGATLHKRALLKSTLATGGAALAGLLRVGPARAQTQQTSVERLRRGAPTSKIKDISVIEVGLGMGLTVVKVTTDQDGLYGYGEASVDGRSKLVRVAVEQYLKPLLLGRETDRIEELWQLCYLSSYYKNDQVQNAAISGVCDALWDIKGREAGMPVYQLVGGKARDAAEVYMHSSARPFSNQLMVDNSKKLVANGIRNVQIDLFAHDMATTTPTGAAAYDPDLAIRKLMSAFEAFRNGVGEEIRLGVDIHSMLDGTRAVQFCKDIEKFKPWYWVEDPVAPEIQDHLRLIREQCATPIALGELWNNPSEWRPVIEQRLVDYIRCHVSHIGGFTAARKVAALAENFEVKFGWHGSSDISPVGHMANLTLDLVCENFGIHEHFEYSEAHKEVFQGCLEVRNGFAWVNEKPGWGIEIDEKAAAKLPPRKETPFETHSPDGAIILGVG